MKYKYISFDLWGTIIKGNPDSKGSRTKYFYEKFNPFHISEEDVKLRIAHVDATLNKQSEHTGIAVKPEHFIWHTLLKLGVDREIISYALIEEIYDQLLEVFMYNLPVVYNSSIHTTLDELKSRGAYISTVSNTGFIGADGMTKALHTLGLSPMIDRQIYSEQAGFSKPNPRLIGLDYIINAGESLHVGDREYADGFFARNISAEFYHCNWQDAPCISNLLSYIEEQKKVCK